jgi:glyceraldehyde-3-phosphate dehydrogenase (NAD(P))
MLKQAGLLRRARGTLLRRATDPWESHLGGIMNTLVPEPEIPEPSRAGCPERRPRPRCHHDGGQGAGDPGAPALLVGAVDPAGLQGGGARRLFRIVPDRADPHGCRIDGLNAVKELMADLGRPHDNLYEVALWSDMLKVEGDELFYAYMVDNQAIVIPETIDAIRALTGLSRDAEESIAKTDAALGIGSFAEVLGRR